jgi:hypothetical protein
MKNADRPDPTSLTRRHALLVLPATVVVALGTACKGGPPASCKDTSGLTKDEIATRTNLKYTDLSGDPKTRCSECRQYIPAPSSDACGTCKVMKGPVHPKGTCQVFTPK